MTFRDHSELKGLHALFSPSQSAWLRYDRNKIKEKIFSYYRAPLGTEIHDFSAIQINLGNRASSIKALRQAISTFIYCKYENSPTASLDYGLKLIRTMEYMNNDIFETVKHYINDAIGYKMTTEQCLVYSDDCFGHADAISFRNDILRIHDLKTGSLPAHMDQLEVYAALFFLEYKENPEKVTTELRLYQSGEVLIHNPEPNDILGIMDQIVAIGKDADEVREEVSR